ncbi:MAG TPA: GNAT family N-acetyltransferase [Candidatus Paceibacterota bacterium]|nr:GNAT family N-acetyltransferase [Candidatus Paceibacterota bacterium]
MEKFPSFRPVEEPQQVESNPEQREEFEFDEEEFGRIFDPNLPSDGELMFFWGAFEDEDDEGGLLEDSTISPDFSRFRESRYFSEEGAWAIWNYISQTELKLEREEEQEIGQIEKELEEEMPLWMRREAEDNLDALKEKREKRERIRNGVFGSDELSDFNIEITSDDRFYFQRRFVFDILREVGTTESIDKLTDIIQGQTSHIYRNSLSDLFSKINPEYASQKLLEELQRLDSTKKEDWPHDLYRKDIGNILYQLELGKIGISEEGVEYFGKLYDLGEDNNPDYFANRISPNGDVGIFDQEQNLKRFFNLGELSGEAETVHAQTFEITHDMLFSPRKDETEEERVERERLRDEFCQNYFKFYSNDFFEKTGVAFNNFNLKEQGQFLLFLKDADAEKQERAFELVKKYGEDAFRAFLSLEHGEEMGESIFTLGEQLKSATAMRVFRKYADILDEIHDAEEFLRVSGVNEMENQEEIISQISYNLSRSGKDLLKNFSTRAEKENKDEAQLLEQLRKVESETTLMAAVFKTLKEENSDFDIEALEDTSIEIVSGEDLLQNENHIERMRKVYAKNYANYPEEFQKIILDSFRRKLEDPNTRFYVLKHADEVVGFDSFTKNEDHLYFGSFNVDTNFAGSKLGTAMMEKTLDEEAKQARIEADGNPKEAIARGYINKKGFVGVGFANIGGVDSLHLVRDDLQEKITLDRQERTLSFDEPFSFDLSDGFVITCIEADPDTRTYTCTLEKQIAVPQKSQNQEMAA